MSGKFLKVAIASAVAALAVQSVALGATSDGKGGSDAKGGAVEAEVFGTKFKDLNYNRKGGVFSGKIKSDFENLADDSVAKGSECTKGRKVLLLKETKRGKVEAGSDQTDADGEFSIEGRHLRKKNVESFSLKVKEEQFLYRVYYGVEIFGICAADSSGF